MRVKKDDGIRGFITNRTYRVKDGKPTIHLFGRLENGESFHTINSFRPYFYIREKDLKTANQIANFDTEKTNLKTKNEEPVIKIIVSEPKEIPQLRRALEDNDVPCYEADIRFTQRFLMEKNIFSTLKIIGDYEPGERIDRIYQEPELVPDDYPTILRIASIDIETNKKADKLYSISIIITEEGEVDTKKELLKKVILVNNHYDKEQKRRIKEKKFIELADNEKEALERFQEIITKQDPDIITGWNLIDFDLKILKKLFEKNKLKMILGRTEDPIKLRIETDFFKDSKAEITGRSVLDGIHLLKSSFLQFDDYKLGTVAKELLGEEKLIAQEGKMEEIARRYKENPEELAEYNLKDSELVLNILDAKKLIRLTIIRSKIVGLPLENVKQSIASFDSIYIRRINKKGYVAPTTYYEEKPNPIKGGFVMEGKAGLYDNIIVLDFKSLYPSIMITLNIDPLSFNEELTRKNEKEKKIVSNEEWVVAINGAVFKNNEGELPKILKELWAKRDEAKKKNDKVASQAFKILMNSFFGVLATPNSRFFNMRIANAITHTGQHIIKLTSKKINETGNEVIYSDTDSTFVNPKTDDYEKAKKIGEEIETNINKYLKKYVREKFYRESYLELELEKIFKKFFLPKTRQGETGAKKRYAGIIIEERKDGTFEEKLYFRGLEFVRKDWTEISKKFQLELLDIIFHTPRKEVKKKISNYIRSFVKELKSGQHDDLLIYVKSLRKKPSEYTKTTPPHVKAAKIILEEEGEITDNNIYYYITAKGPEPVKYRKSPIDYDHYIEKQLKPIADSILLFFNTSFDDLIRGTKQETLFNY